MSSPKNTKYVYIAGPIDKGDQFLNCRNAILAGEELRLAGHYPYLPHLTFSWHMITPVDYEAWMDFDFAWIKRCDVLVRLFGESAGSDREVTFALSQRIPVFYSVSDFLDSVPTP